MIRVTYSGELCTKLTVWLTTEELHRIFSPTGKICQAHPLEVILAKGTDSEKRIDRRQHRHPWHIDLQTPEQIQQLRDREDQVAKLRQALQSSAADHNPGAHAEPKHQKEETS